MSTIELERRLTDLETLVWELPNLLDSRLARLDTEQAATRAALQDHSSRLTALERGLAALRVDVRDFRAAVTRQLLAQDERFAKLEARMEKLEVWMGKLEVRIGKLEENANRQFAELDAKLSSIAGTLAEIMTRLPLQPR